MRLAEYLDIGDIIPDLSSAVKGEALEELIGRLLERHAEIARDEALRLLLEREYLGSTGIGDGVAIPHAKLEGVEKPLAVFGRSRTGIPFDALDGKPVHLFFLLVAGNGSVDAHLRLLARISRLLKNRTLRRRLLEAPDADALYGIIVEQDSRI